MNNIAVIGVGALGRRHLQSALSLKEEADVYAVEINEAALEALKREMPGAKYVRDIEELPQEIAVAVISTSSNVRRALFERLTAHARLKYVIFEKVLFPYVEDYEAVQAILREKNIRAWVNCARREWDAYQALRQELKDSRELYVSVLGGQWGLGCNGIHMLDLIQFLSDSDTCTVDLSKLEPGIVESKRKGFFEFFGTVTGTAGKCRHYAVTCMRDSSLPLNIEITTERVRIKIDEGRQKLYIASQDNGWAWETRDFPTLYQSQMTGRVVKSILGSGKCRLTDYGTSMKLHLAYITPLMDYFKNNGMEGNVCPIT